MTPAKRSIGARTGCDCSRAHSGGYRFNADRLYDLEKSGVFRDRHSMRDAPETFASRFLPSRHHPLTAVRRATAAMPTGCKDGSYLSRP